MSDEPETTAYFGDLTFDQKQKRMHKIKSFFGFIEYDWGDEKPGPEADWKTGAKEWQIFKEVHGWAEKTPHLRQMMKRNFYTQNVDKDFENTMIY